MRIRGETSTALDRLITEAELLTSEQSRVVVALAHQGDDTDEARQILWELMDQLGALRDERAMLDRTRSSASQRPTISPTEPWKV